MATMSPAVRSIGPREAGGGGLTGAQEGNDPTQDGHEGHGSWGALKVEVERFARLDERKRGAEKDPKELGLSYRTAGMACN